MAAHDGALDGGGQARVGPVAGQEEPGQAGVRRRPWRLAGVERKGGPALADRGAPREPGARGSGHGGRQLGVRQRHEVVVAAVHDVGGAAAHERHMCGVSGGHEALLEGPLERPPRQADELRVEHGLIEPQVHGDDRRRAHLIGMAADVDEFGRRLVEEVAHGVPRHARDHGRRLDVGLTHTHAEHAPVVDHHLGRRARSHRAAVPLEEGHTRLHERVRERLRGQHQRRVVWSRPEHAPDHFDEGAGRGPVDGLIERSHRERFPQQLHQAIRLPPAAQPRAHGHRLGLALRARLERPRQAEHRQPVRPGQRRPGQHAGHELHGRRQGRAAQFGRTPRHVDHGHGERRLHVQAVTRADPVQIRQGVVIAAEQHVLAVVHPVARQLVAGGEGAPAEHGTRLDHHHPRARLGQGAGGAQARAAGADHDGIRGGHGVRAGASASTPARIRVRAQVVAASQARAGRGTRTTSVNTS